MLARQMEVWALRSLKYCVNTNFLGSVCTLSAWMGHHLGIELFKVEEQ